MKEYHCISTRSEKKVAGVCQLSQLAKVIDFAVEYSPQTSGGVSHWLPAGGGQIENRQTRVTKGDGLVSEVPRLSAPIIRATVLQGPCHRADDDLSSLWIQVADSSRNSAHTYQQDGLTEGDLTRLPDPRSSSFRRFQECFIESNESV